MLHPNKQQMRIHILFLPLLLLPNFFVAANFYVYNAIDYILSGDSAFSTPQPHHSTFIPASSQLPTPSIYYTNFLLTKLPSLDAALLKKGLATIKFLATLHPSFLKLIPTPNDLTQVMNVKQLLKELDLEKMMIKSYFQ